MTSARAARPVAAAVLAAGEGKRLKSSVPKVLHEVCGKPMLGHVLHALAPLRAERTVIVVGRGADEVAARATALTRRTLTFAHQARQLGTADAARTADEALGDFEGEVVIVPGDGPLITARTLKRLLAHHRRSGAAATLLSAVLDDPTGYGRILRDEQGMVRAIVEEADATPEQRALLEVNSSVWVFDRAALRRALKRVDQANKQKEFYLTDVAGILREDGEAVQSLRSDDPTEILGANSRAELAAVAALLRSRINAGHMAAGVTIVDPAITYIDAGVRIGPDTVVHPLTFLSGSTQVGGGCEIGPGVRAKDSLIADGARVSFAVLDRARVDAGATVGPYTYLRPGAHLERGAKAGSYVEIKASRIGRGSKVPHLSYIGDAVIGADVNIGAATVTVNYDAETKTKAKTVIRDGAKIGSDTMLIAPVTVGKGAVTGAGSVVTHDVPAHTVVVGAPARPLRKRRASDGRPGAGGESGKRREDRR